MAQSQGSTDLRDKILQVRALVEKNAGAPDEPFDVITFDTEGNTYIFASYGQQNTLALI